MVSEHRSRTARVALWFLTILDAVAMVAAGASKFANAELWRSMFEGWGYAPGFSAVVGSGEVVLAILLLVPSVASWAALGLIVVMLGALGTVLTHPQGPMGPGAPLVHLLVLSIILVARWRARWRPGS